MHWRFLASDKKIKRIKTDAKEINFVTEVYTGDGSTLLGRQKIPVKIKNQVRRAELVAQEKPPRKRARPLSGASNVTTSSKTSDYSSCSNDSDVDNNNINNNAYAIYSDVSADEDGAGIDVAYATKVTESFKSGLISGGVWFDSPEDENDFNEIMKRVRIIGGNTRRNLNPPEPVNEVHESESDEEAPKAKKRRIT